MTERLSSIRPANGHLSLVKSGGQLPLSALVTLLLAASRVLGGKQGAEQAFDISNTTQYIEMPPAPSCRLDGCAWPPTKLAAVRLKLGQRKVVGGGPEPLLKRSGWRLLRSIVGGDINAVFTTCRQGASDENLGGLGSPNSTPEFSQSRWELLQYYDSTVGIPPPGGKPDRSRPRAERNARHSSCSPWR